MEGQNYREGKEDQGHYLGGLLHELEVGLSIRCQLRLGNVCNLGRT
jgi:hypothetical protein